MVTRCLRRFLRRFSRRVLRLVLVLALVLPGLSPAAAEDPIDEPYKTYFPWAGNTQNGTNSATCEVVYQDPADGTVLRGSAAFDVRWTIRNTGTIPWRADSVDIRFISGARMHSGPDARDMPYDVDPGNLLDMVVSMTAPSTAGSYVSNWALLEGTRRLCSFYVKILVKWQ